MQASQSLGERTYANEQTSLGVLMTPAQKAAYVFAWYRQITTVTPVYPSYEFSDKICAPDDGWKPLYTQSALDAAVEQRKQRELELADSWRNEWSHASNGEVAACALECADELESLAKEK